MCYWKYRQMHQEGAVENWRKAKRLHEIPLFSYLDQSKKKNKSLGWYWYIPSFIMRVWLVHYFKLKFQRVRLLEPAWACLGAYARRPPEYAFLLMRACACVSIYGKKMLTYNFFSESAWYSASFESYFSFLRQFWFCLLFLAQNLMTLWLSGFDHMQYHAWNEWFLRMKKIK